MDVKEKQNANPTIYTVGRRRRDHVDISSHTDDVRDVIDTSDVYEMVRNLNDPEHPLTLEQLKVVQDSNIVVDDAGSRVSMTFTPTIPHCSMATLIGLCLKVKLIRSLPRRFKVHVSITPGTHASEEAINKQLDDKERVAAAMENEHLLEVVHRCVRDTDDGPDEKELATALQASIQTELTF